VIMAQDMIGQIIGGVWVLALVMLAGLLLWLFVRSRNPGYLLLLVAIPAWPLISRVVLTLLIDSSVVSARSAFTGGTRGDILALVSMLLAVAQATLTMAGIALVGLLHDRTRWAPAAAPPAEREPLDTHSHD